MADENPDYRELVELRHKVQVLEKELSTSQGRVKELETELNKADETIDDLDASLKEAQGERDGLRDKLRGVTHREAFMKAAKDAGAEDDFLDDLYTLSGYQGEGDEPDEGAISKAVEKLKSNKPRYFREDDERDERDDRRGERGGRKERERDKGRDKVRERDRDEPDDDDGQDDDEGDTARRPGRLREDAARNRGGRRGSRDSRGRGDADFDGTDLSNPNFMLENSDRVLKAFSEGRLN